MSPESRPLVISTPKSIAPVGPAHPQVDTIEPAELLGKLWRGRLYIASIIALIMAATGITLSQVTPRYSAETLIMIDHRQGNTLSLDPLLSSLSLDSEAIASEIEILKSRELARKVVEHLDLHLDPEFNTALRPKGKISEVLLLSKFLPQSWRDSIGMNTAETSDPDETSNEKTRIMDTYLKGLNVSRKGTSRAIKISYTSESPDTAANITNAVADLYISEQLRTIFEATRTATQWLYERVEPLRKKVQESETAVEKYRQSAGLNESKGITLNSQQMAELNSQLIIADTEYTEARTRLRHINRLLGQPGGAESAPEVLRSGLIQRLREQEVGLQRKIGELSTEYGESHPTMIQLRAELGDLQDKINAEVNKIASGIRNEAEIARVRKLSLENSLNKLKERDADKNEERVKLQALEREAEADRNILEALLARLKEASTQDNISTYQPGARVISYGDVPLEASSPKTLPILALMLVASTLTGILALFFRESIDNGFRSCEEVEAKTGLPALGLLPRIQTRWSRNKPESSIVKNPESDFAESIRTLYTNTLLTSDNGHTKTVLITSAEAGEGSTTTAACLARMRALSGSKTLIIDLNLRTPGLATVFGARKSPGIVELLSGEYPLEEVIHIDAETGTHVITAGAPCLNPSDILMGQNLDTLLHILSDSYDLIILDSPAIMTAPDTRLLLARVDTTIFVVRWLQTKRKLVNKALAQVSTPRGHLAGVVLNMVDTKNYSHHCPSVAVQQHGQQYEQLTQQHPG